MSDKEVRKSRKENSSLSLTNRGHKSRVVFLYSHIYKMYHACLPMLKNLAKKKMVVLTLIDYHPIHGTATRLLAKKFALAFFFLKWLLNVLILISDEEVFQKHFEVTPSSGVLTEESLCVVCKIRPPVDNWQSQTVARVSISIMQS